MTAEPDFRLVACDPSGAPEGYAGELPPELAANCAASAKMYRTLGYRKPWVSYVALADGAPVGGGAFVGAPRDGAVEIAYFTVDALQGRGYAGQTAAGLVQIARAAAPEITLLAKTLPGQNPSTRILQRLGFQQTGEVIDDDAGLVWEWRLPGRA